MSLPQPDVSSLQTVALTLQGSTLRLTSCFVCFSAGPSLLLSTMDSQMEEVRHRIRNAEVEIVEVKQEIAIAKQAGNRGGEVSPWPAGEAG